MPSHADRYIEQVRGHVFADRSKVERLEADLRSHFDEAEAAGETPQSVVDRLGSPEEVAASFMADIDVRYAGFWARLVAFLGDAGLGLLLIAPIACGLALLGPTFERAEDVASIALFAMAIAFALGVFGLCIFYFPVLEHLYGRTFGKRMIGLRVLTEDGASISLGTGFLRRLTFFFDVLWLDALFIPFTQKKQRAFDIVAKTVVVHDPDSKPSMIGWVVCLAPWIFLILLGLGMAVLGAP